MGSARQFFTPRGTDWVLHSAVSSCRVGWKVLGAAVPHPHLPALSQSPPSALGAGPQSRWTLGGGTTSLMTVGHERAAAVP